MSKRELYPRPSRGPSRGLEAHTISGKVVCEGSATGLGSVRDFEINESLSFRFQDFQQYFRFRVEISSLKSPVCACAVEK